VRKYQVHLIGRGLKVATIIPIMCALRFLYGTTLGLKDVSEQVPLPRKDDTPPTVLSRDEVTRSAPARLTAARSHHFRFAAPSRNWEFVGQILTPDMADQAADAAFIPLIAPAKASRVVRTSSSVCAVEM
jgi:hypothetical protein